MLNTLLIASVLLEVFWAKRLAAFCRLWVNYSNTSAFLSENPVQRSSKWENVS